MRCSRSLFLTLFELARANTHNLFCGAFDGSTVGVIEYDDATETLSLVQNASLTVDTGSKWIALDEGHRNLYVATTGAFQSYAVTSNLSLQYRSNVTTTSSCTNTNFISAMGSSPFTAILTSYGSGCASLAASVDESGSLKSAFANVTYDSAAAVHGTSLSSDGRFIYSADDPGNAVWSHSYDSTTGVVTEIQKLDAPSGSDPRHLAVHPNGEWVYVVFEASSEIATYKRDVNTGLLTFTNVTYPLLPTGYNNASSYWADEALFSIPSSSYGGKSSPKYLIAATRSRTTDIDGYVSAFALNATTGAITEQIFLVPTTASGGSANAVSPSPFDEETFAITDSGSNFIEVWKINGSSAVAVSHLDTAFGPANIVWYS